MTKISVEVPASAICYTLDQPIDGDDEIIIRPLALSDAPKIVEAIEESLPELVQFMPWAHIPQTLESQRTRIVDAIHHYWTMTTPHENASSFTTPSVAAGTSI